MVGRGVGVGSIEVVTGILGWVVPPAIVVIAVLAFVSARVFARLVFRLPDHRLATDDDVPPHLPGHLAPAPEELGELGVEAVAFAGVRRDLRHLRRGQPVFPLAPHVFRRRSLDRHLPRGRH